LKCRLKSTGVNYKTSTKTNKTQTQYKYIKQITKQRNQNNIAEKKQKITEVKFLNLAKLILKVDFKISQIHAEFF
jgi:hypothetical protein